MDKRKKQRGFVNLEGFLPTMLAAAAIGVAEAVVLSCGVWQLIKHVRFV